jgi:hypothetical protein
MKSIHLMQFSLYMGDDLSYMFFPSQGLLIVATNVGLGPLNEEGTDLLRF